MRIQDVQFWAADRERKPVMLASYRTRQMNGDFNVKIAKKRVNTKVDYKNKISKLSEISFVFVIRIDILIFFAPRFLNFEFLIFTTHPIAHPPLPRAEALSTRRPLYGLRILHRLKVGSLDDVLHVWEKRKAECEYLQKVLEH